MIIDLALAVSISKQTGSKANRCWHNAYIALSHTPGLLYVEGWVKNPHLPIMAFEHGWCETEDGERLLEVTPNIRTDIRRGLLKVEDYYAGLKLTAGEFWEHLHDLPDPDGDGGFRLPLVMYYYRYKHPAYWAARDRAEETMIPGLAEFKRQILSGRAPNLAPLDTKGP